MVCPPVRGDNPQALAIVGNHMGLKTRKNMSSGFSTKSESSKSAQLQRPDGLLNVCTLQV